MIETKYYCDRCKGQVKEDTYSRFAEFSIKSIKFGYSMNTIYETKTYKVCDTCVDSIKTLINTPPATLNPKADQ